MNESSLPRQISTTRSFDEYQKTLCDLFGNRLYLTMDETAGILGIEVKTLRELANAGRITFLVVGAGMARPRRRFTRDHVAAFLEGAPPIGGAKGAADLARLRESVRLRVTRSLS